MSICSELGEEISNELFYIWNFSFLIKNTDKAEQQKTQIGLLVFISDVNNFD